MMRMQWILLTVPVDWFYHHRTAQVGAENGYEEELTFRLHPRFFRQVGSQVTFGKEIGKIWREAASDAPDGCDQSACLRLIGEAERGPLRVLHVILFKRKDMMIAHQPVDDADPAFL